MSEYREGFCVEKVTSGCKCQPLSVYESYHMGAGDFHNMTEGLGLHGVGGDLDNEGVCPKCQQPVRYHRYLVVTDVPPALPVTELERELLAALQAGLHQLEGSTGKYDLRTLFRDAIAKAEGRTDEE
jgi:hypothetical protein